jgi:hypothetical protein
VELLGHRAVICLVLEEPLDCKLYEGGDFGVFVVVDHFIFEFV